MAFCSLRRTRTSVSSNIGKSKKKALNEVKGIRKLFTKFEIPSDARVLDFCCGIGNHSIPLSNSGYSVVGYDPSETYLRIAKEKSIQSTEKYKKIKFIRGDPYQSCEILLSNKETNFDVIMIMDNSFGYLGKSNDIVMLKNLFKVANKNCILIMETENRDWRLKNFEPVTLFEASNIQMLGKWKFDFETSVSEGSIQFYERNPVNGYLKESLKLQMLMRLYSLHELKELIGIAGWTYRKSYDDIATLKAFLNGEMSIFTVSSANKLSITRKN